MSSDTSPVKFEQALAELEQVVEQLEKGHLDLEDAIKLFERGMELSKHCQTALEAAEQRVQILLQQDDGAELAPFKEANDR